MDDIEVRDKQQDVELKGSYGWGLLALMFMQVLMANVVFLLYAALGQKWDVPPSVVQAWLAATVVEVIGIATVVVRYLFPSR